MRWEWKNCPKAWHGSYKNGKEKYPTVIAECWCDHTLRIWHLIVGTAGACNDINVLDRSNLASEVHAMFDGFEYELNGSIRNLLYLFTDGIYPEWKTFVKTLNFGQTSKKSYNVSPDWIFVQLCSEPHKSLRSSS